MKIILKLALFLIPMTVLAQAPQIPLTGNIGSGFDGPLINSPAVIFATDADHTMVYPEMSGDAAPLILTSSVTLTATRNLLMPNTGKFTWPVKNMTTGGQTINVLVPGGTSVPVANGQQLTVVCDGTNCTTGPQGTVTSVTATAPVVSSGGTTPVISCPTCIQTGPSGTQTITQPNGTSLTVTDATSDSTTGNVANFATTSGSTAVPFAVSPFGLDFVEVQPTGNTVGPGSYLPALVVGNNQTPSNTAQIISSSNFTLNTNGGTHDFGGYSTVTGALNGGWGVFDAEDTFIGSLAENHFRGYQSRTNYNATGGLSDWTAFGGTAPVASATSAGTIGAVNYLWGMDFTKTAGSTVTVTNDYGIHIGAISNGITNYGIETDYGGPNTYDQFGNAVVAQNGVTIVGGGGTSVEGTLLTLGSHTERSTSTPAFIDMGGTFSPTDGADPKLCLYYDGTSCYGFGVAGYLDYDAPATSGHEFFVNGSQVGAFKASGLTLPNLSSYSGDLPSIGSAGLIQDSGIAASNVPLLNAANTFTATNTFNNATYSALFTGGPVGIGTTSPTHNLEVNGTFQSGTATLGASSTASNGSTQTAICLADGTGGCLTSGGNLGTPSAGVATNLTGTASALNIGGNAATATYATNVQCYAESSCQNNDNWQAPWTRSTEFILATGYPLGSSDTSMVIADSTGMPSSGHIVTTAEEEIGYASISTNTPSSGLSTLNGLIRGMHLTPPAAVTVADGNMLGVVSETSACTTCYVLSQDSNLPGASSKGVLVNPGVGGFSVTDLNITDLPSTRVLGTNGSGQTVAATVAGSGAGLTTGPTTSTSGDLTSFTGTAGQIADSGIAASSVQEIPGAWTHASATVTCSLPTGLTYTSDVGVSQSGKTANLSVYVNVTAVGDCTDPYEVTLPVTAVSNGAGSYAGSDLSCTNGDGDIVAGIIQQGTAVLQLYGSTGGSPISGPNSITCGGVIETN